MPLFAEVNVLWPNGLLNRYTVKSCIGGSNPPLSASKSLLSEKLLEKYLFSLIWRPFARISTLNLSQRNSLLVY